MKKTFKRLIVSVLSMALLISALPFTALTVNAAGQTSITLKHGKSLEYASNWGWSDVELTADGKTIYCVQPDLPAPPTGTYRTDKGNLTEIKSSDSKYNMYRKALYYCYGGDGFNIANNAFKTNTSKHHLKYSGNTPSAFMGNLKYSQYGYEMLEPSGSDLHYLLTHLVTSYINYGDSAYKSKVNGIKAPASWYEPVVELYNALKAAPNPPISIKLYMLNIGDKYQKVLVARNSIKLQLQKSSSNKAVTGYSLAGAKYNIYLDKTCKDYFGYIETDSSGYGRYGSSSVVGGKNQGADVPVQAYYCKEVTAPKGFELNTTVYEFKKTSSSADGSAIYRVNSTDQPLIKLQLMKSSANKELTDDNSCYSLTDAKYNIYTDSNCTNYYSYITTDENGYGRYGTGSDTNTDAKDKNTAAYNANSGKSIALKSGVTYYAKEETAPKGYELDETVYQFKDSGSLSSGGVKIFRAYNLADNKQPSDNPINDPVGIVLQKRNAVTGKTSGQGLEGAVFQVQYYAQEIDKDYDVSNGDTAPALDTNNLKRTWYIKTLSNGRARLSSNYLAENFSSDDFYYWEDNPDPIVPIGTVVIKEVKAPEGYTISNTVFYRRITEEGAKFAQDTNTPIEVPIDEQPANGYVGLHKMNNSRQDVLGAEYGLYSDSGATVLLSSLVTDGGNDVFDYKCNINKTYYIKEINAPAGYSLDSTIYPITPTEENRTIETAVIQDIYEDSLKGNIKIKKSSDDGILQNLWFAVVDDIGNEYNPVVTDKNGEATVTGLPVYNADGAEIKYTVKELGFKVNPGKQSYGGYTWTVKESDCVVYKGVYYEGIANTTYSDYDYQYSRYYYGDNKTAVDNANGYTKTLLENNTVTYEFKNSVPDVEFEITKNSYDGRKSGFWFKVEDQFGNVYGEICTDDNGTAALTSENAYRPLYSCIPIPNSAIAIPVKYKVTELGFKSPGDGRYYLPDVYKEAYVSELMSADIMQSNYTFNVSAYNYPDTGRININKSSEDDTIEDLCFRISAFEDDTEYSGEMYDEVMGYDSSGNAVHSIVVKTDSKGYASTDSISLYDSNGSLTDGLPVYVFGTTDTEITYEIEELGFENGDGTYTLPKRYEKNEPIKANLLEHRSYTYNCNNKIIPPGKLQILKTAEDNEVENLWFNIKSVNIPDIDINVGTGEDGATSVIENLPVYVPAIGADNELVQYTVTELGFNNGDDTFTLPPKYESLKPVTVTLDSTDEIKLVKFHNVLKTGSVTLYKQDYDGKALAGSQWALHNAEDDSLVKLTQTGNGTYTVSGNGKVTTLDTNAQGKLYITKLAQGDYYFVETKSPNGTAPYGRKVSFTISADSSKALAPVLTVKNDKIVMFETGGNGIASIYFIGSAMLAASLAIIFFHLKKGKSNDKP